MEYTITNSTIKDNGQEGIYNLGGVTSTNTSTINVNNTVISGNGQEGIVNSSIANVKNSTIHSNKDGGFTNFGSDATATITNSVIRDNTEMLNPDTKLYIFSYTNSLKLKTVNMTSSPQTNEHN